MDGEKQDEIKQTLTQILAVVGFISIIGIGLWGTVQAVRFVPKAVSTAAVTLTSIFRPVERIEVSVPSLTLPHGEIFTLTWEHINRDQDINGAYTIRYGCRGNFSFDVEFPNGMFDTATCDTDFNFINAENEMRLIPLSTEDRFLDVPITVTFTPTDERKESISDEILVTIENKNVSESPDSVNGNKDNNKINNSGAGGNDKKTQGTKTEETRLISGGITSDPHGRVDLAVRVLEVGYIQGPPYNIFNATSSVELRQRAAVRFIVENLGTKTSPQWTFNAVLPTKTIYIFSSKTQPVLGPGDRIEYTIGFDKIKSGPTETVTINVDPTHSINEVTRANNIAKADIEVFKTK